MIKIYDLKGEEKLQGEDKNVKGKAKSEATKDPSYEKED